MKHYELLYILPADHTEEELAPYRQAVSKAVTDNNGQILSEQLLGKRKLAYPIQKVRNGYYILIKAELEPGAVPVIHKTLEHDPKILRHIFIEAVPNAFGAKHLSSRPTRKKEEKEVKQEAMTKEQLDTAIDQALETPKV
ncbi:MAG: 30S ribosomal protein S6 [bacterium]